MFNKVSAICPTYGRAQNQKILLEECLFWFTQQTYPHKELILLNDCPGQTLICPHPEIVVINHPTRFKTLGEKYDYAISKASGEIIMPWEDDDISLPNRMDQAVLKLKDSFYFNPQHSWYEDMGVLHSEHNHGVCHNASAYKKIAWEVLGGYGERTGNQDLYFDTILKREFIHTEGTPDKKDWQYIYRWNISHLHLSQFEDMQKVYTDYKIQPQSPIVIFPRIDKDYLSLTKSLL